MKFFLSILFIAAFSVAIQLVLPWWSLVIAAGLAGAIFPLKGFESFISGFLGVALVWWFYALMIDVSNQSILSERVAAIFQLGSHSLLILACGVIAGIVAGFAALSGNAIKKLI